MPGLHHLFEQNRAWLESIAQQVGFEYARLSKPASVSEAMLDSRFAYRKPVPTDLYWIPAAAALLILAFRFGPLDSTSRRRSRAGPA